MVGTKTVEAASQWRLDGLKGRIGSKRAQSPPARLLGLVMMVVIAQLNLSDDSGT